MELWRFLVRSAATAAATSSTASSSAEAAAAAPAQPRPAHQEPEQLECGPHDALLGLLQADVQLCAAALAPPLSRLRLRQGAPTSPLPALLAACGRTALR